MSTATETISQLRPIDDLPLIPIDFDFDSSDNFVEDDSTCLSSSSTPGSSCTPVTPSNPMTDLASSYTSFDFSESDTASFSVPTKKRKFTKKLRGFQKGDAHPKQQLLTPKIPDIKKKTISPTIKCNFPTPQRTIPKSISLKKDEQFTSSPLTVLKGSEIMSMGILCHVVSLLQCNELTCTGNLVLHKTITQPNKIHKFLVPLTFDLFLCKSNSLNPKMPSICSISSSL